MLSNRKLIRRKIIDMVEGYFPDLKSHGRLPGYRYCFSTKLKVSPTSVPVFLHLLIQHHRRKDAVFGYWEVSYFSPPKVGRNLPEGVSAVSVSRTLDERSEEGWERFREALQGEDVGALLEKLKDHDQFEIALWQFYRNESTRAAIPEQYKSVITELVAQPGFTMSQPTQLNLDHFLKGYVPEQAQPEEGQFSLESSRARRKLADFQLTDPQSFVVHLISGAVAGGSEKVDVYVDSDDIIVEFGGRILDRTALEQLFANLLSGRASPQGRELAVALNAASSLDPKKLLVESWQEGKGLVLEIDEQGEQLHDMEDPPQGRGHRVHFRDRPSLKVLKRFLNSLKRDHPELDLIRKRCARAPIPILLEHREDCRDIQALEDALFHLRWMHPEHPLLAVNFSSPGVEQDSPVDASALLCFGSEDGLDFLIHGVHYEPPEKIDLKGLYALVCDNKATRDLSFTGLVADERWAALKERLEAARDHLLMEIVSRYEGLEDQEKRRWAPHLRAKALRGASEFLTLRMFERLDGTLADRATLLNHSVVKFTGKDWKYGLRSGEPVYKLDREAQNLLWGATFRNVDEELASSQGYFVKKESWLQRKPLPEIRFQTYQGPRYRLRGMEGEVVPAQSPQTTSVILTHAQGRPLLSLQDDLLPPGVKVIANHDGLDVDDHWQGLLQNEALEEVRRKARVGARDLYESLMAEASPSYNDYLLHYLLHLKSRGENWAKYAPRIKFGSYLDSQITLAQILAREHSEHKTWQDYWEETQRRLKTLAVPVSQLLLVRKLNESS